MMPVSVINRGLVIKRVQKLTCPELVAHEVNCVVTVLRLVFVLQLWTYLPHFEIREET